MTPGISRMFDADQRREPERRDVPDERQRIILETLHQDDRVSLLVRAIGEAAARAGHPIPVSVRALPPDAQPLDLGGLMSGAQVTLRREGAPVGRVVDMGVTVKRVKGAVRTRIVIELERTET